MFLKGKAKKNRKGRKCQWKENFVDDLADIIVKNGKYRQKYNNSKCEKCKKCAVHGKCCKRDSRMMYRTWRRVTI